MGKLNSMRLLEKYGVPYEVFEFPPEIHSAEGVAEAVGVPPETVYKTLVAIRENGKPVLALIAGGRRLDLKKLGAMFGERKARMAHHDEAEKLTGLKVGGISALALTHKKWPVFVDETARSHESILLSAGKRGVNLRVPVDDLIRVLGAQVADISSEGQR